MDNKSLKLLADPNKLKNYNRPIIINKFKEELQIEFRSNISSELYEKIINSITHIIFIHNFIKDIIDQVVEHQNLTLD